MLAGRLMLANCGLIVRWQLPLVFDGQHSTPFRIGTFWLKGSLALEIKAVDQLSNAHTRQLLTYLQNEAARRAAATIQWRDDEGIRAGQ